MHKERLLKLSNIIEANSIDGLDFNMLDFYHEGQDCGTYACMAGWAVEMMHQESDEYISLVEVVAGEGEGGYTDGGHTIYELAKDYLYLDEATADKLFYGTDNVATRLETITRSTAVQCLRTLVATGEVVWKTEG